MNNASGLNVIVWSFDRPTQLQLCLDSLIDHFKEVNSSSISVIYKASSSDFIKGYDEIRMYFKNKQEKENGPEINFIFETNFFLLTSLAFGYHPQTMFVVDDQVFFEDFSVTDPTFLLHLNEPAKYFTISLRLDPTKTFCYPVNQGQKVPLLKEVAPETLAWNWQGQDCDWGYVVSLDGNIYHTNPIRNLLMRFQPQQIINPNTLEMVYNAAGTQGAVNYPAQNLCYYKAKTASLPINKVQNTFDNRAENTFTAQELLEKLNQGFVLDKENIKEQARIANSVHAPVQVNFIKV